MPILQVPPEDPAAVDELAPLPQAVSARVVASATAPMLRPDQNLERFITPPRSLSRGLGKKAWKRFTKVPYTKLSSEQTGSQDSITAGTASRYKARYRGRWRPRQAQP